MSQPTSPKRFVNASDKIVQQALEGLIISAGNDAEGRPRLQRLAGYPHTKVIVRGDWNRQKVAIISGGGAGHEPAHAGFVGEGMLTAAVSGEIFASPSVEAVLQAIVAVSGDPGCLLVVKNYTGDRLNFGLAAERAKQMGIRVEMVIVGDDIAIPGASQARGVAGTLFVHKFAGYLAEHGHELAEIKQRCASFAQGIYSLGISLGTCAHPGRPFEERLEKEEAELGLGIHGEPGRSRIPMQSAQDLIQLVAEQLETQLPQDERRYGLLLNNLGAVPPMEMGILMHGLSQTPLMEKVDYVFGPGHFMTALNMNGISVSLVALDEASIPALLAPVGPSAWPQGLTPASISPISLPEIEQAVSASASPNAQVQEVLEKICQAILAAENQLNTLDAMVGDGDTGTTFARGAKAVADQIPQLPLNAAKDLLASLGAILSESMGGSSGILLSILLSGAAAEMGQGASLAEGLQQGLAQMQFYGGAREGARTMLDALAPALRQWVAGANFAVVAEAADFGALGTASVHQTNVGRSSYLTEEALQGIEDPGARAVAVIFQAAAETLAQ